MNHEERSFAEEVTGLLDEGTQGLDSRTGERLERIRMGALQAAIQKERRPFLLRPWFMAGSFATATLAAVGLFFWLNSSPEEFPPKPVEDFEIITSREHFDLYKNIEFYRWLATRENGSKSQRSS